MTAEFQADSVIAYRANEKWIKVNEKKRGSHPELLLKNVFALKFFFEM
jgi:hypothetical protein